MPWRGPSPGCKGYLRCIIWPQAGVGAALLRPRAGPPASSRGPSVTCDFVKTLLELSQLWPLSEPGWDSHTHVPIWFWPRSQLLQPCV